jgi:formylglycine-generating enzyme required for sulfatase activity
MWPWKMLAVLLLIVLISGSCSKDSSEEYAGGVSTVAPADDFTVISTIPEDNATKVSVNASFVISFSRELKTGSVNENNFFLSTNGSTVAVTVTLSKKIVVLLPASSLSEGTNYTASVSSEVQDTSGNSLGQDSSWKFTTVSSSSGDSADNSTSSDDESSADTTKPSFISITPADNSSSISVNTTIIVVFSEEVSSVSLSSSTFKLLDNTSNYVSSSYSINGSTVTFTPTDNLSYFQDYKVSLTTGIQDTAGNALSSASSSGFETLGGVVITSADSNGMILLSGGRFQMGADNQSIADGDNESDETPTHTTELTGLFYISDHEVSSSEFKACVDSGSCNYTYSTSNAKKTYAVFGKENHPMNYVNWNEAVEYADWLTSTRSGTYRLCTEAEWEYAVRAGTTSKWSCGNNTCTTSIAWYDNTGEPQEVRTKSSNQWGLYDMHGNVREWVSDNYSNIYYIEVTEGVVNPQGPEVPSSGTRRSQRGGYYGSKKADIRSADRFSSTQTTHSSTAGFRVCADP